MNNLRIESYYYSVDRIKEYINLGGDINATDKDGWVLLFHAIINDCKDSFDFLIENGADINIKSNDDNSLLSIIISCPDLIDNYIYFLKKLLENGVIIDKITIKSIKEGWYADDICYTIIQKHIEDLEELEIKHVVDE